MKYFKLNSLECKKFENRLTSNGISSKEITQNGILWITLNETTSNEKSSNGITSNKITSDEMTRNDIRIIFEVIIPSLFDDIDLNINALQLKELFFLNFFSDQMADLSFTVLSVEFNQQNWFLNFEFGKLLKV